MKNLAIMGAMLYVMAYGPGPLSLGKDDGGREQSELKKPSNAIGCGEEQR